MWGSEDRILPPRYARWLHDRIPHAELHWIDGAGHVLQEDAPAQLLAHLTSTFEQPAPEDGSPSGTSAGAGDEDSRGNSTTAASIRGRSALLSARLLPECHLR
ncbi:alpha/beta fold hydrolase [Salinifilum aidingensis]